ncbi:hypothetical protein ACFSTC_42180 [Nonomuraea ferruginea]
MLGGLGAGAVYGVCGEVVSSWYPDRPAARVSMVTGAFGYGSAPLLVWAGLAPAMTLSRVRGGGAAGRGGDRDGGQVPAAGPRGLVAGDGGAPRARAGGGAAAQDARRGAAVRAGPGAAHPGAATPWR